MLEVATIVASVLNNRPGLVGDFDLGSDNVGEGVLIERIHEAVEVLPLEPQVSRGHEVDYACKNDCDPDYCMRMGKKTGKKSTGNSPHNGVEDDDSQEIPFDADPAPDNSGTIDPAAFFRLYEEKDDGGDEGGSIAYQEVSDVQGSQSADRPVAEEGEVDIDRPGTKTDEHCQDRLNVDLRLTYMQKAQYASTPRKLFGTR